MKQLLLLLSVAIMLLCSSCNTNKSNRNELTENQIEFVKQSFCPFYNGQTTYEKLAAHFASIYGTVTWETFEPVLEDGKTYSHIVCAG